MVRRDDGVSSVELAVIAPTLLLLIFFVIQGALYFYGRSIALQSAREGVTQLRLAQTRSDCTQSSDPISASTVDYATSVGRGVLDAPQAVAVCNYPNESGGDSTVTIRVRGQAISLIGFDLPVDESVTGRVEQFQDGG